MDLMNEARKALMQWRSRLRAREAEGAPQVEGGRETLSEQDHRELQDIEEALARMAGGEFGRCSRCGGAIGRHRLRAIPETRYCLTCSAQVPR